MLSRPCNLQLVFTSSALWQFVTLIAPLGLLTTGVLIGVGNFTHAPYGADKDMAGTSASPSPLALTD
jgi:hypothetical protein